MIGKLKFLRSKTRIFDRFNGNLNSIFHFWRKNRKSQHLIVEGEDAVKKLLSAYVQGLRDFSGSNLRRAELYQSRLSGIILKEANLSGCDLWMVDLTSSNLSNINLTEANLIEADLRWANLSQADLSNADLIGADLRWANLRSACLRDTDLTGADLIGSDLTDADLSGAILDAVRWKVNDTKAD
jgi:uncharacterized protein YjbI with pentapeptide repeats